MNKENLQDIQFKNAFRDTHTPTSNIPLSSGLELT